MLPDAAMNLLGIHRYHDEGWLINDNYA